MQPDDLTNRFGYHPPKDERTIKAHEFVRKELGDLAQALNLLLPEGREKSLAITHLEDAMMWANAAIARNGGPQ